MSLTKLLKAPIKLFRKDIITFVIIRRYDLGIIEEKLRYIAVKPSSSISVLRHKVWILLDLPDYCEEVIVLKSPNDVEVPLTDLRKGNDPQHPYVLEVWLPSNRMQSTTTVHNNMLTMGDMVNHTLSKINTDNVAEEPSKSKFNSIALPTMEEINETLEINKHLTETQRINLSYENFKKSDVSCRISSTSLFKLNGRKSRDNFINVLLKIQSDLCTLSNKLSHLETRIPN
ncbi:uncharacterized protein LOC115442663 [Manduca sexta]|uniref:uncharacterized protein LOC115442663 n=1 Tax=Manduca sexta TaxID=7130 RepID=UPI00188F36C2|nr:uncharacterized protein LOC115442663 [Manduca sexta]